MANLPAVLNVWFSFSKRPIGLEPVFAVVIGEVTPQSLCIHTSANFEWDPPRLVVYCANHKIFCCGFET